MSTPKKRSKRTSRCSSCGRLAIDHAGPVGKKCQLVPFDFEEETKVMDKHDDSHSTKSDVLNELADQMSQMAISMKKLQDDMVLVKNSQSGHSVVAGTSSTSPRIGLDLLSAGSSAPTATTEASICLPSGAKISPKIQQQTRTGEYINLSDYAPCLEPSIATETSIIDGELIFRPKRNVKNIDSLLMWSLCWRGYEEALVSFDHRLYPQLAAYRIFIQTCAAKHWWAAVYNYDVRNRANKSMTKSFDFHVIDNDVYVTTLDTTTTRQNIRQCTRCRSIWHIVKDCPFAEDGAVAQGPRAAPASSRTRQSASNDKSQQICFNWNAGRCTGPCQRRHVCEGCGGPDPRPRCPTCNFFSKNKPPPNNPGTTYNTSGVPPQQSRLG
jgi:hypothetical protein